MSYSAMVPLLFRADCISITHLHSPLELLVLQLAHILLIVQAIHKRHQFILPCSLPIPTFPYRHSHIRQLTGSFQNPSPIPRNGPSCRSWSGGGLRVYGVAAGLQLGVLTRGSCRAAALATKENLGLTKVTRTDLLGSVSASATLTSPRCDQIFTRGLRP